MTSSEVLYLLKQRKPEWAEAPDASLRPHLFGGAIPAMSGVAKINMKGSPSTGVLGEDLVNWVIPKDAWDIRRTEFRFDLQADVLMAGPIESALIHLSTEPNTVIRLRCHELRFGERELRAVLAGSLIGKSPDEPIIRKSPEKVDSERWYRDRVSAAQEGGWKHNRDEDLFAGRQMGLTRPRILELRATFAPAEWSRPGRPRNSGVNSGEN